MEHAYIYGLIDPRDRRIHYIGHTIDMESRLDGHIRDTSDTPKTRWIADLAFTDIQPEMVMLDCVDYNVRFIEEYRWIYLGRFRGWPLTNTVAMKTENYAEITESVMHTIFVETESSVTWMSVWKMIAVFFAGDWLDLRYFHARMAILNLSVLLMAIGSFLLLPGPAALSLPSGISPWQTWAIASGTVGMYIFFSGSALMMPFAIPLFVRRCIETCCDVRNVFRGNYTVRSNGVTKERKP